MNYVPIKSLFLFLATNENLFHLTKLSTTDTSKRNNFASDSISAGLFSLNLMKQYNFNIIDIK